MRIFLGSPRTQLQASMLDEMDVLVSFALWSPFLASYAGSFGSTLIDSGAYSEMTGYASVSLDGYRDFLDEYGDHAVARAGLDDIRGDWKRSLRNYAALPTTFPTFHDSDPPELLDELVAIARERDGWIGVGLVPPRQSKETWVRSTVERIPEDLHVHGWALGLYAHVDGIDSFDSTNWFRDSWKVLGACPWLTPAESLEIVVKKYRRRKWRRRGGVNEGNAAFQWGD